MFAWKFETKTLLQSFSMEVILNSVWLFAFEAKDAKLRDNIWAWINFQAITIVVVVNHSERKMEKESCKLWKFGLNMILICSSSVDISATTYSECIKLQQLNVDFHADQQRKSPWAAYKYFIFSESSLTRIYFFLSLFTFLIFHHSTNFQLQCCLLPFYKL